MGVIVEITHENDTKTKNRPDDTRLDRLRPTYKYTYDNSLWFIL